MTAKAISFRRGNTLENDEYVGVVGEITVDLGSSIDPETGNAKEDDGMATLRIHIDEETKGGIALARADFRNCNPANLTSGNEGLAFANLSNIKYSPATDIDEVKEVLDQYGIAHSDAGNLNTAALSPNSDNIPGDISRPSLARRDMSNVDTTPLATEKNEKNLAYANLSNVNTSTIKEKIGYSSLALANLSNTNTQQLAETVANAASGKRLAYSDLSNASPDAFDLIKQELGVSNFEVISNKTNNIVRNDANNTEKYVTPQAVIEYTARALQEVEYANLELDNVRNWELASYSYDNNAFKYSASIKTAAGTYEGGEVIDTNIQNGAGGTLSIIIANVNDSKQVTDIIVSPSYGANDINTTFTDTTTGSIFAITTVGTCKAGNLALADLSNVQPFSDSNSVVQYGYSTDNGKIKGIAQSLSKITVTPAATEGEKDIITATDISMTSSELDASGNLVSKIGVENVASNKGSGIIITQAGAYVNHNESTAIDDNHKIVKKQDLTSHTSNKNNPHGVTKAQVGLGNVDNTADKDKPISNATQAALDLKATVENLNAHKNDKNNPHGVTKAQVGLGNVDNTSDLAKPISTATQTALNGKADKSTTYTKTEVDNNISAHTSKTDNPHNVTKAQVGLGNVDNTSDANKPISTATRTELNLKANKSDTYTKAEVDAKISSVYHFMGSVANQAALPTEGQAVGDTYNVEDTGANYAWTGTTWDKLSETIDLSGYATKTDLNGKQNTLTAGEGISIVGNVISNTQTSAEWGKVTGTLSSQTDLQGALDAKADDSAVVHKAGGDTIFAPYRILKKEDTQALKLGTVSTDGGESLVDIAIFDDKGVRVGVVRSGIDTSGNRQVSLVPINSADIPGEAISVKHTADGTVTHTALTPKANSNGDDIATTAWVNTAIEAALGTVSAELASIIGE